MPSIKVYGSSNNSIKSEEITKLPAISFEITNEITKIPEIQETPRFYSPKTYKHEKYIFRDLEEFKEYKFTNLK
jgi:hypothetical protein